jgi:hypothetical protein
MTSLRLKTFLALTFLHSSRSTILRKQPLELLHSLNNSNGSTFKGPILFHVNQCQSIVIFLQSALSWSVDLYGESSKVIIKQSFIPVQVEGNFSSMLIHLGNQINSNFHLHH